MASNPLGSGPFLVFQKDADGSRKGNVDDGMELPLAIANQMKLSVSSFNFKEVGQVPVTFQVFTWKRAICATLRPAA